MPSFSSPLEELCFYIQRNRMNDINRLVRHNKLWTLVENDDAAMKILITIIENPTTLHLTFLHHFLFTEKLPRLPPTNSDSCLSEKLIINSSSSHQHSSSSSEQAALFCILLLAREDFDHVKWVDRYENETNKNNDKNNKREVMMKCLEILQIPAENSNSSTNDRLDFCRELHAKSKEFVSNGEIKKQTSFVDETIEFAVIQDDIDTINQLLKENEASSSDDQHSFVKHAFFSSLRHSRCEIAESLFSSQQLKLLQGSDTKNTNEFFEMAFHECLNKGGECNSGDLLCLNFLTSQRIEILPESFEWPIMDYENKDDLLVLRVLKQHSNNDDTTTNDHNNNNLHFDTSSIVRILLRFSTLHPTDSGKVDEKILDAIKETGNDELFKLFFHEEDDDTSNSNNNRSVDDIQSLIEDWFHEKYYPVIQDRTKLANAAVNGETSKVLDILKSAEEKQTDAEWKVAAVNVNSPLLILMNGRALSAFEIAVECVHPDLVRALLNPNGLRIPVDFGRATSASVQQVVKKETNTSEIGKLLLSVFEKNEVKVVIDEANQKSSQSSQDDQKAADATAQKHSDELARVMNEKQELIFKFINSEKSHMELQKEKEELTTTIKQLQNKLEYEQDIAKQQDEQQQKKAKEASASSEKTDLLEKTVHGLKTEKAKLEGKLEMQQETWQSLLSSSQNKEKELNGQIEKLTKEVSSAAESSPPSSSTTMYLGIGFLSGLGVGVLLAWKLIK